MRMARVKKVLLEEQAQRREKKLREEMDLADKEAAKKRMDVNEPQTAWTMPQQMSTVPPGEYVVRQSWGLPDPPPGRSF